MGINTILDGSHKTREVDLKSTVILNEISTLHTAVSAQGVESHTEGRNVEDVPKATSYPTVKQNLDGAHTSNRGLGVIGKKDILGRRWAI